ncbi:MAG TPA: Ig-like domain-containing protein, partial [Verrucomicrobiota bacterium]|nr:Ig-like domain-containing protein [Verrucomicrobiota bacterium]
QTDTVVILSPTNNTVMTAPTNMTITASATSYLNILSVGFIVNGVQIGVVSNAPYTFVWNNVQPGDYQIQAYAVNSSGLSVTSAPVKVTVLANAPPFVSITSPANGSKYKISESIPIIVSATDEVQVARVEFYANDTLLSQMDTAPFQFNWNPQITGNWSLKAVATDITGLKSTSAPVNVTIYIGSSYGGLSFDGNNDYVTFGVASGLGTSNFTLELWFKWTGAGSTATTGSGGVDAIPLIAKGRGESDGNNRDMNYFLGIDPQKNVLVADFEEGATGSSPGLNHPVIGRITIPTNVWTHAAVTYNGANWYLYVNDTLDTNIYVGQPPRWDSIQHASLGAALKSSGAPAGAFGGIMDEVRIWNYARTASDISSNMNKQIAQASGLIGRWSLNETNGTTAYDSSGGNNNGTLVNGPVWCPGYTFAIEPFIFSVNPLPDSTITNLTSITVTFTEPVTNVDASDLLINGTPATGLTGSGTNFTFTFAKPSYGYVYITWASNHNIVSLDDPLLAFSSSSQGATFKYYFLNPDSPIIVSRNPESGYTVSTLTNAVVTFNKPVKNVDASDLLINGVPATEVHGSNAIYEFIFPQPQYGLVNFVWASNHGITDLSSPPNAFDNNAPVANWSVYLIQRYAPYIWYQYPPANSTVTNLTQIQIIFSQSVTGVDASDLLINGSPATSVSGSGSIYTFTFPQPPCGIVQISWATNHGITDVLQPPLPFDSTAPGSTWTYTFIDLTPPTIVSINPAAGSTVNELSAISVVFSEPVVGVDASDLLINGTPATRLFGSGTSYTFYFSQPDYGTVQISWSANSGITDLAPSPNAFNAAGSTWQYNLEPIR